MVAAVNNNTGSGGRIANGISTERERSWFLLLLLPAPREMALFRVGRCTEKTSWCQCHNEIMTTRQHNLALSTSHWGKIFGCTLLLLWVKKVKQVKNSFLSEAWSFITISSVNTGFTMFEKWRNSVAVTSNGNNAPIIYTQKHEATQWLIWQPAS